MHRSFAAAAVEISFVTSAVAADLRPMVPKAPPAFAPGSYSWTGFYVGVQLGWQTQADDNDVSVVSTFPPPFGPGLAPVGFAGPIDLEGAVGGVHSGFNYQVGQLILGIEADIEASNVHGSVAGVTMIGAPVFPVTTSADLELNWQASVRGRLGFAIDRLLIYATGGVSFADFDANTTIAFLQPVVGPPGPDWPTGGAVSDSVLGFTIGGGFEWASLDNWTARLEYRYTEYDGFAQTLIGRPLVPVLVPGTPTEVTTGDISFHTVRLGVSYKFGGAQVVARY